MSVIVYGPQGCGKSLNAQQLMRHFNLKRVIEADELSFSSVYLLIRSSTHLAKFKAGDALYLTHEPPPPWVDAVGGRRVVAFEEAIKAANA